MMKKVRTAGSKVLALLLAVCMMIGLVPVNTFAAGTTTEKTATETNVQKVLDYAVQMKNANSIRPFTTKDKEGKDVEVKTWSDGYFTWDTEMKKDSWRYFNGVMMDAFLMTKDSNLKEYVSNFYNNVIQNNAEQPIIKSSLNSTGYIANELDSVVSARPLFDLLDTTSDDKYKTAIKYVYNQLKQQGTYSNCGGNYVHKQTEPATGTPTPTDSWKTYPIGLDGLYMAETFLMDCAKAIEARKIDLDVTADSIYTEVFTRFHWVAETMYDSETGLYHHGWNPDPDTNKGNGHFWSRGIGWYAMALVDTIELMPAGTNKETLKTDLKKLFDGMLKYQDASGLWYNVVNKDAALTANNGNKLETSGSSMMAYALMKAYNNGWVTEAEYGEAGLKAFNGVVADKMTGEKGSYIVTDTYRSSGVCTTDDAYCKNPYTNDEAKGTAALIMASTLATTAETKLSAKAPSVEETTAPEETTGTEESKAPESTPNKAPAIDNTAVTAEGVLSGTTQYVLDTDGIDDGAVYLVVNTTENGQGYAVRHNTSDTSQSVTIKNNVATISENASECEWTFTKKTNPNEYAIKNGSNYLAPIEKGQLFSGNSVTVTSNGSKRVIEKNVSGTKYYVTYDNGWKSKTSASESESKPVVYLYKKTETPGKSVTLSATPSSITFKKGMAQQISTTVTYDGSTAASSKITWISANEKIASVSSAGVVTGVKAGTVTIVARLDSVNGKTLSSPILVRIPVTVTEDPAAAPENPYEGLNQATDYPVYPNSGAVRINKTALSSDFQSTGVTKIELDAAGISIKQGVDVVLVVDVSNSMAWTDDWFVGKTQQQIKDAKDPDKIPKSGNAATTTDKLDIAMNSAKEFADILLKDNVAGASTNNSISFVTFAGFDKQNTGETGDKADYIDSVQTVFTGVEDANTAKNVFSDTKFTNYAVNTTDRKVTCTLQIGQNGKAAVSGINRGNTNYDYAFAEANKAVSTLKSNYNSYNETGRQTVVVFMTDGAPSHYNDQRVNGGDKDRKYGTNTEYPGVLTVDANSWLSNYMLKPNTYAQTLNSNVDEFYAVGFDLDHGGFSSFTWTENDLKPVLANITGTGNVPVELASTGAALADFYKQLANRIKLAGTYAKVTDVIDSNFTLQTKSFGVAEPKTSSTIEVIAYDLYTKAETSDVSKIGTRSGAKEVLETVTFSADGTTATSDKMKGNILSTANGVTTIKAKYFTYTKDAAGKETFVWNIGDITEKEVALSYYAYLKGSMEGTATAGIYNTNESAILEYVDVNGDYAKQTYRKPTVSWGSAITKVEYYLVNEAGQPVNYAGDVIPFANRIVIPHTGEPRTFNWNEEITISGAGYVPNGYALYETDPEYTVIAYSGQQGTSTLTIPARDTTTKRVDSDTSCANTCVAFAVLAKEIKDAGYELIPDQIVIDYGKSVTVDVLANDTKVIPAGTASVIGFAQYRSDATLTNMQTNKGTTVYTGNYGKFSIDNNKVMYTPNKMLSAVEKVFVVVKVTDTANTQDYYYMYQELDVIPATIMYYETDFATEGTVFKFSTGANPNENNKWKLGSVETDNSVGDNLQDTKVIGTDLYGQDSSYNNDRYYSNHDSYEVTGQEYKNPDTGRLSIVTKVDFSFTGTGFDLISMTGPNEGSIRVMVYSDPAKTKREKAISVMNRSDSDLSLYQIPVMSIEDLPYGVHYVEIGVASPTQNATNTALNNNGQFKFDAIRIFNPIDVTATTDDADIAAAAYMSDGEINPQISEVRNMILDGDATIGENVNGANGVVFVDLGKDVTDPTEYKNVGPNNEVYLKENQAIGFKINKGAELPASIDLGAKSADGNAVTLAVNVYKVNGTSIETTPYTTITKEITSSTAQFYDLFASAAIKEAFGTGNQVFVTVQNTSGSGILSITDLKVADGVTPAAAMVTFMVDEPVMARMFMLGAEPVEPEVPTEPEIPEESETPEESVVESNADILSAKFTKESVKQRATATIRIESTAEVETLTVVDAEGNTMNINIKNCKVNSDGNKEWKVAFKATTAGMQTFTVTGFDAEGNSGETKTASIEVRAK